MEINFGSLGAKVIIKECHKMPDVVGHDGKIVAIQDAELFHYSVQVMLLTPVHIDTPWGLANVFGPFPFRPDELELEETKPIPPAIEKAFEDKQKPPETGKA